MRVTTDTLVDDPIEAIREPANHLDCRPGRHHELDRRCFVLAFARRFNVVVVVAVCAAALACS